jgi:hypothetical protein
MANQFNNSYNAVFDDEEDEQVAPAIIEAPVAPDPYNAVFDSDEPETPEPSEDPYASVFDEDEPAPATLEAPEAPITEEPKEAGSFGMDLLAAYGAGSNNLLKSVGTIYGLFSGDMDNWARREGEYGAQYYEKLKSSGLKGLQEERSTAVKAADGFFEEVGVSVWQTVKSPRLLTDLLVSSVPAMVAGGALGRGAGAAVEATGIGTAATAGAVATGTTIGSMGAVQGADVAGDHYEQLVTLPEEVWSKNEEYVQLLKTLSPEEAKDRIAVDSSIKVFALSTGLSIVSQKMPGGDRLEKILAGKRGEFTGNFATRAVKGAIGEGLQESVEEGGGQIISNIATQNIDPTKDTFEGVGETVGTAFVAGGAFGLSSGALSIDPGVKSLEENQNAVNVALDNYEATKPAETLIDTPIGEHLETPIGTPIETPIGAHLDAETEIKTEAAPDMDRIVDNKGRGWRSPKNAEVFRKNQGLGEEWQPAQEGNQYVLRKQAPEAPISAADQPIQEAKAVPAPTSPDAAELHLQANEAAASPLNDKIEPTEAQIEADNYSKGHVNYDGLKISIENPAGSKRKPEWPTLAHHYGDIKSTVGADGDPVDVYLNKDNTPEDTPVFVINQTNKDGSFDETKVMLGFVNHEQAVKGYMDNFTPDWNEPAGVHQMSMDVFKDWLQNGDTKAEYVPADDPRGAKDTSLEEAAISDLKIRESEAGPELSSEEEVAAQTMADRRMEQSKTAKLRTSEKLTPDSTSDDLITYIRKLGGINTDTETDIAGRLSHLNEGNKTLGLPGIEQKGGRGLTLDQLGENLIEAGFLEADPNIGNGVDKTAVIELLSNAESRTIFSKMRSEESMEAQAKQHEAEQAEASGEYDTWLAEQQEYDIERLNTEVKSAKLEKGTNPEQMSMLVDRAMDVDFTKAMTIISEDISDAEATTKLNQLIKGDQDVKTTQPDTGKAETSKGRETTQKPTEAEQAPQPAPAEKPVPDFELTDEVSTEQELADLAKEKDTKRDATDKAEPSLSQSGDDLFARGGQLEPDLFAEAPAVTEPVDKVVDKPVDKKDRPVEKVVESAPVEDIKAEKAARKKTALEARQRLADVLTQSTAPEGDQISLGLIQLETDTGEEIITQSAQWWLDDVDSRIKEVNKLRDCI